MCDSMNIKEMYVMFAHNHNIILKLSNDP